MKKFMLLFSMLMFFGFLIAEEETPAEPLPAQTETTENSVQANTGEQTAAEETAVTENPEPAEENRPEAAEETPAEEKEKISPESDAEETAGTTKEKSENTPEENTADSYTQTGGYSTSAYKEIDKPSRIYFQPVVGMEMGASLFSFTVNLDLDVLLKQASDGTNIYFGLGVDFRYTPYLDDDHPIYELPVQLNLEFDFPTRNRNLSHAGLWFSGGIDFAFGYLSYYDYKDDFEDKDKDKIFRLRPSWGMGVNLLFRNNLALKMGFDSFYGKYPNLICAVGYRF